MNSTPPSNPNAAAVEPSRIDVHAHYLPKHYREEVIAAGRGQPDGFPYLPDWSATQALEVMDRNGIATAMLSISSPGVHFGDDAKARALSRSVNEDGARTVHDYPGRFGLFASLPLPDVEGSLRELSYAMDVLHADGIVIETNHHGIYPGDARLDPVFEELNRRKAVLFIHPTSPNCACCNQTLTMGYPAPLIEFLFETSRAVTNMILQGTLDRFPDIRLIIPHAGATLPLLLDRLVGTSVLLNLPSPLTSERMAKLIRSLHFDVAGFPVPNQLKLLLEVADHNKLLYGSDWPFTPEPVVSTLSQILDGTPLLKPTLLQRVLRDNALTLFPRLA
ncbi:amidohydrolase family protein [Pseudomonas vanderleydeniana]|uniref:Amidohydrolase n=1 Tax=Pseudomonas vanderleydeniana TaxID=2745495 RepID=A0A9E6PHC4_9PSED|nr:amidohydrolase family protein [Pseudomonas vanderleydeniana]QXI26245.1 amidohydrolase [Pseudomonas vanderleydeniana]